MRVEMYFGYFVGSSKTWETDYVDIPDTTYVDEIEAAAREQFLQDNQYPDIAFCGVYCVSTEEDL